MLLKGAVWVAALAPLTHLAWRALGGDGLGANPVETLLHFGGFWTLAFLTATLAVTPIRRLTGWNDLVRVRRLLGLWAFFYACVHVLTYAGLDQSFMVAWIVEDVVERPFITAGMGAFLLLLPLAATSTRGWIRRLGKRWRRLHSLVYLAGGLGVIHFLWSAKADSRVPELFGAGLVLLLALRLRRGGGRRSESGARNGRLGGGARRGSRGSGARSVTAHAESRAPRAPGPRAPGSERAPVPGPRTTSGGVSSPPSTRVGTGVRGRRAGPTWSPGIGPP